MEKRGSRGSQGDSIILEEEIDPNYVPSDEEVIEYAKWLGMDPSQDTDLFWIAREGLKAPLPESWKPCKTKDTEEIYYFNFSTGASTWDHPCDEYYRRLYEEEKRKLQGQHQSTNTSTSSSSASSIGGIVSGIDIHSNASGLNASSQAERNTQSSNGISSLPTNSKRKAIIDRSSLEQEPYTRRLTPVNEESPHPSQLQALEASREAAVRDRDALQLHVSRLQAELRTSKAETKALRATTPTLTSSTAAPSNDTINTDDPDSILKAQLEQSKAMVTQAEHARTEALTELSSLRQQAGSDRERCTALERDLQRLRQERDRNLKDEAELLVKLRNRANRAEDETKKVREEYEERLQVQTVRTQKEVAARESESTSLREKLQSLEHQLEARDQEQTALISTLRTELSQEAEDRNLQAQKHIESEKTKLKAEVEKNERDHQTNRIALEKLASDAQREAHLATEKAEATQQRCQALEADLAASEARFSSLLIQSSEDTSASCQQCAEHMTKIQALTHALNESTTEKERFEPESAAPLNGLTAREAKIDAEAREARMAAEAATRRNAALVARCDEAETRLRALTEAKNAAESRADAAEARISLGTGTHGENTSLEDETRKKLTAAIEAASANEKEARRLLNTAEDRLAVADAENNRFRSELEALTRRCQQADVRADNAESTQADFKRQVHELRGRLETQQKQSARLLSETVATEKLRFEALMAESERLKARCATAERETQRAQEQRDASRRQVELLGDRLAASNEHNNEEDDLPASEQDDQNRKMDPPLRAEHRAAPSSLGVGLDEDDAGNIDEPGPESSEYAGLDSSTWRSNRLDLEHEALNKAKILIKRQREWLRRRQRKLLAQRDAWRRSHRSEHTKQKLDAETDDLNRLIRQLRTIQSWLSMRDAKLRSVNHDRERLRRGLKGIPAPEDDYDDAFDRLSLELDDDARSLMTILNSADEEPSIPHQRTNGITAPAYFVLQPDGPPLPVYYSHSSRYPPHRNVSSDSDDQFRRLQESFRLNTTQAKQNYATESSSHKGGMQLEAWAKTRTNASRAVETHVQWLARLKAELTAHCYANSANAGSAFHPDSNGGMRWPPYMAPPIIPPPPELRPPPQVR